MHFCLILLVLLFSPAILAHGLIHEQLKSTDQRIAKEPNNAALYVHRGRLYLDEDHIDLAIKDFRRALKIEPSHRAAHYFLGEALLNQQDLVGAERESRAFIAALGEDDNGGLMRGYRLLGHSLMGQHKSLEAAEAYQMAIKHAVEPTPSLYLECAAAYRSAGKENLPKALAILDEGITKLGPLTSLQEAAIEIDLQENQVEAGIARLDSLIALGKGTEYWLFRKGDLLIRAGRNAEGCQAYKQALAAISAVSVRRKTVSLDKLKQSVEGALAGNDNYNCR